jgi:hypothetical protein
VTRRSPTIFFGDFVHRGQDAADTAGDGFVGDRAVRHREVRLFDEAMALELEFEVLDPRRRAAMVRRVDERLQDVPDFTPALAHGNTQRPRMLLSEDGPVRIVVDRHVLGSPPEQQRKAIGEQEPHHHAKRRRP